MAPGSADHGYTPWKGHSRLGCPDPGFRASPNAVPITCVASTSCLCTAPPERLAVKVESYRLRRKEFSVRPSAQTRVTTPQIPSLMTKRDGIRPFRSTSLVFTRHMITAAPARNSKHAARTSQPTSICSQSATRPVTTASEPASKRAHSHRDTRSWSSSCRPAAATSCAAGVPTPCPCPGARDVPSLLTRTNGSRTRSLHPCDLTGRARLAKHSRTGLPPGRSRRREAVA